MPTEGPAIPVKSTKPSGMTLRQRLSEWMWPGSGAARRGADRVVVCQEWLTSAAGSDKVAAEMVRVAGADALYCFAARDDVVRELGISVPVYQSRLGGWASVNRRWQFLLPVMPLVWGLLDLGDVRLVLTSSHSTVNSVRRFGTRVSYCHTPMRYAWDWRLEAQRLPRSLRPLWPAIAAVFRRLDRIWSRRVDVFVANSHFVAERIKASYGRDAIVVYPPIDTGSFVPTGRPTRDRFVVAGRLVHYKRPDIAVQAANLARVPMTVAGAGPELERLQAMAGSTIEFAVAPDDDELIDLVQNARALVFPGIEDFGMTVVEAQACGTPVIGRAAGGALESVNVAGGGLLVDSEDPAVWARRLAEFECPDDVADLRRGSEAFSVAAFRRGLLDVLVTVGFDRAIERTGDGR